MSLLQYDNDGTFGKDFCCLLRLLGENPQIASISMQGWPRTWLDKKEWEHCEPNSQYTIRKKYGSLGWKYLNCMMQFRVMVMDDSDVKTWTISWNLDAMASHLHCRFCAFRWNCPLGCNYEWLSNFGHGKAYVFVNSMTNQHINDKNHSVSLQCVWHFPVVSFITL